MARSLISSPTVPVERPGGSPRPLSLTERTFERSPGSYVVDLRPAEAPALIPTAAGAHEPSAVERYVGFVDDERPDALSLVVWRVPDGVRFWLDVPRGERCAPPPPTFEQHAVHMWTWSEPAATTRLYWLEWEQLPNESDTEPREAPPRGGDDSGPDA